MYTWLHLLLQIVIVPEQVWGTYAHTRTLRSSRNLIAPFASGWSRHQRSWQNHPPCLVWAGPGLFTPWSISGIPSHRALREFFPKERFWRLLRKGAFQADLLIELSGTFCSGNGSCILCFFTGTFAQFAIFDKALKEVLDGLWVRSAIFDTPRWGCPG